MKKIGILFFLLLIMTFCSCKNNGTPDGSSNESNIIHSDITISDFESKVIKEIDDNGKLLITEIENGFSFEYTSSMLNTDYAISGVADKNKYISSIQVEAIDEIDIDYFNSLTEDQLLFDLLDQYNVPINRLAGEYVLWDCSYIVKLCSNEQSSEENIYGLSLLLDARNSSKEKDGWTYSISTNESMETIRFTATFGK